MLSWPAAGSVDMVGSTTREEDRMADTGFRETLFGREFVVVVVVGAGRARLERGGMLSLRRKTSGSGEPL